MNGNPFLLNEAQVAFYFDDGTGSYGNALWMGGQAERLTLSRDFKERVLNRPGDPDGRPFYEDEDHSIEMDSLWLEGLVFKQMPMVGRNQKMALVIVWYDTEVTAWVKRTYYDVKQRSQKTSGVAAGSKDDGMQAAKFRAASMAPELAGLGSMPDMLPVDMGAVRYCAGDVYLFDYPTGIFSSIFYCPQLQMVVIAGVLTITINGHVAAVVTAASFRIAGNVKAGTGSYPQPAEPCIEFYCKGRRLASLTQSGNLCVPDIVEQPTAPDGVAFKALLASAWAFSMGSGKVYAPAFIEGL